ncbi:MAG: hypothetical protein CBE15_07310 [Euryarchaeota archaeon TMED255]|nr:MAG: hypothetical protein CBE15_07310 [Euryarchaeota archaeon TMED255]|tara:strand:- start:2063 stop:2518 length:456 start_codon:yes stop_codon:yes gene_type:complete
MLDQERLNACIQVWIDRPGALLPLLHDVQSAFGFIPPDVVEPIAKALNISRAEVHGVVSFYEDFKIEVPAKHLLKVCCAEACQAVGSRELQQFVEDRFGEMPSVNNDEDGISVEAAYCFGNCASGPTIELAGRMIGRMTPNKLSRLLDDLD